MDYRGKKSVRGWLRQRWYAFAVLALAMVIAAPGLVAAQSFASGDDQMFTATDLCTAFDSRFWTASEFGGDTKPQASTNYSFRVRGPSADLSSQGGSSDGCGVPTTADVVLLNLLAISPGGGGNLKAFASDVSANDVSGTVLNFNALSPNINLNNAVSVPMDVSTSNDEDITVRPQGSSTHIQGVVLGYYENVTDGFYTESQSDSRFALRWHDHGIVEVTGGGVAAADTTTTIVNTDYTIADECLFGDNHNVLVRVTGYTTELDDLDVSLQIAVNGATQASQGRSRADSVVDDEGFTLQKLVELNSGTHPIAFRVNNGAADSTGINSVVLTIERMGWTCDPIVILSGQDDSSEESVDQAPDGSDRENELSQDQSSSEDSSDPEVSQE